MKKNINSSNISTIISRFLFRFHFVLFIVIVLGSLSVIILLLNQTLISASNTDSATPVSLKPYDKKTIEVLEQLKPSNNEIQDLQFPEGRVNPMSE